MGYVVFFAATGITLKFVYTFLYLFFNQTVWEGWPGKHRHPNNIRSRRHVAVDVKEIITTGDILTSFTPDLKDGFIEVATPDGAMLNNEGFKTY